jgi:endonuclease-3 related protein
MDANARKSAESLASAGRALVARYAVHNWWPAQSRFEVMVGAVLVQNTRWSNVRSAIAALRRHNLVQSAALAKVDQNLLTNLIRPAGCQRVKAGRLIALAAGVQHSGGVRGLAQLPTGQLRRRLLSWHGVGEETADAIALYAFVRPVFISDSYARRWLSRMGIFEAGPGQGAYRRCQEFVHAALTLDAVEHQYLHAAIVLHGQRHCAKKPRCSGCLVSLKCQYKQ